MGNCNAANPACCNSAAVHPTNSLTEEEKKERQKKIQILLKSNPHRLVDAFKEFDVKGDESDVHENQIQRCKEHKEGDRAYLCDHKAGQQTEAEAAALGPESMLRYMRQKHRARRNEDDTEYGERNEEQVHQNGA